jgi:hypothetical protein
MAIETRIDRSADIRIHTASGELTFDELRATLQALYSSPDFRPEQHVLWDLREAVLTRFSLAEVRDIADLVAEHRGTADPARAALVVSRDVDYGMARMFEQVLAGGSETNVRVFRDLQEAMAWITEPTLRRPAV